VVCSFVAVFDTIQTSHPTTLERQLDEVIYYAEELHVRKGLTNTSACIIWIAPRPQPGMTEALHRKKDQRMAVIVDILPSISPPGPGVRKGIQVAGWSGDGNRIAVRKSEAMRSMTSIAATALLLAPAIPGVQIEPSLSPIDQASTIVAGR
jgi:hypothetical protein